MYLNPPENAVVLCVDEKTGMQARADLNPLHVSRCAGPPPPEQFGTLLRYLRQVVEGRPATELEQTLRLRPRP